MAIRRIKKSRQTHGGTGMYRSVFTLDGDSDIKNLPTDKKAGGGFSKTALDSLAFVIGDGSGAKILMLGRSGWVEV